MRNRDTDRKRETERGGVVRICMVIKQRVARPMRKLYDTELENFPDPIQFLCK